MEDATMEEQYRAVAAQLRKPHGEYARQVGEKMNEGNAHINRHTIQQLTIRPNGVVLEVGMGNGFFLPEIFEKYPSCSYIGCDFSEEMVRDASERNHALSASKPVSFIHASADQLPVSDHSIDALFTVNTIYFWPDPALILREFRRVLVPGGQLIIAIRPKESMQVYPFTKYGFIMYSRDELIAVISSNGFCVQDVLELDEPPQQIDGQEYNVYTLIVSGIRE